MGFYKSWVGGKLFNKAWQGRGTHIAHCGWRRSSEYDKNHPLARHISIHISCLADVNNNLPKPGYDINDFELGSIMAVEF